MSRIQSHDPTHPRHLVGEFDVPDSDEVATVIARAAAAQPEWAASAPARSEALGKLAEAIAARNDEFTDLIVREVGKPVVEARGEIIRTLAILRYYAQAALDPVGEVYPGSTPRTQVVVRREPLGLVLTICPWNFPLAIPIWKAAPALAYGNCVLMKPASPGVTVAGLLSQVVSEVLPEGVMSVLFLPGSKLGRVLDDERIGGATFTGSTQAGLAVAARLAARGAPAQAEMGGQNPAVVLEDADPDAAAAAIVSGAMNFAGQKCTATRRAIAVGSIADRLEDALAGAVASLSVGDPSSESTTVGPLIDGASVIAFGKRVAGACERGGRVVAQAEAPLEAEGHFVAPTVLAMDDPDDEINQEETFGPLLTLIRVRDEAAAVEAANATRYGLVAAVHGRAVDRAAELASRLEFGLQRVNAATPGVDYYAPFGGEGRSSFGPREQGRAAREFFTSSRTMTIVSP